MYNFVKEKKKKSLKNVYFLRRIGIWFSNNVERIMALILEGDSEYVAHA